MKELLKRTLSGIVFVALPVVSLLTYPAFFIVIIAVASLLALRELNKLESYGGRSAPGALFLASAITWFAVFMHYFDLITSTALTGFVIAVLLILIVVVLTSKTESTADDVKNAIFGYIYTQLGFLSFYAMGIINGEFDPHLILFFFILVWTNDTFAYLSGKSFGKRKLFERLSPGKTWEGTAGGAVFAIGTGYLLSAHVFEFPGQLIGYTGIIAAVFAGAGDLFQSSLKRKTGVKDTGNLIPGHGGILDRFDAALFAVPACGAFIRLFA